MFIHFTNDRNRIRWHVVESDANTYRLASCGFNNQVTQVMGKAVFDEALQMGLIVKEAA